MIKTILGILKELGFGSSRSHQGIMQSLSHGEYSPNPLAEDRGRVGGIGTGMTWSHELRCWTFQNLKMLQCYCSKLFFLYHGCAISFRKRVKEIGEIREFGWRSRCHQSFRVPKRKVLYLRVAHTAYMGQCLRQRHGKACTKGRQTLPDSWLLKVEDSRRFTKLLRVK